MYLIYHPILQFIFAPIIVCVLNEELHLLQSMIMVFEHWTIVLQVRAGSEVSCGTSDGD